MTDTIAYTFTLSITVEAEHAPAVQVIFGHLVRQFSAMAGIEDINVDIQRITQEIDR